MKSEGKAWVGIDLDGTLARYDIWVSHLHIGEPVPEMIRKIHKFLDQGYQVKIFTARMSVPEHVEEVSKLIADYTLKHVGVALEATCQKDYGMVLLLDDRAREIVPNTGLTLQEYWEKQGE